MTMKIVMKKIVFVIKILVIRKAIVLLVKGMVKNMEAFANIVDKKMIFPNKIKMGKCVVGNVLTKKESKCEV